MSSQLRGSPVVEYFPRSYRDRRAGGTVEPILLKIQRRGSVNRYMGRWGRQEPCPFAFILLGAPCPFTILSPSSRGYEIERLHTPENELKVGIKPRSRYLSVSVIGSVAGSVEIHLCYSQGRRKGVRTRVTEVAGVPNLRGIFALLEY